MEQQHIDEINKMVGTEFTYVFSDRSELPAIVAAFDPEKAFTCLATNLIDSYGYDHRGRKDHDGNFCLVGFSSRDFERPRLVGSILFILRSIRCLGYYRFGSDEGFGQTSLGGSAVCSF